MVKKKIGQGGFLLLETLHFATILMFYMGYLDNAGKNITVMVLFALALGVTNYLIFCFFKGFNQYFSFEYEAFFVFILFLTGGLWIMVSITLSSSQSFILFIIITIISTVYSFYRPYYTLYILLAIYILLLLLYAILMKEKTILSFLEMLLVWAISYLSFYIAFKKTLPKMEMHIDMAGIPFLDRLLSRKKS